MGKFFLNVDRLHLHLDRVKLVRMCPPILGFILTRESSCRFQSTEYVSSNGTTATVAISRSGGAPRPVTGLRRGTS